MTIFYNGWNYWKEEINLASITEELQKIKNAIFGKDVRGAIHDAIKKTYDDAAKEGNANMEVSFARGFFNTLSERLNRSDEQLEEAYNDLNDKHIGTEREVRQKADQSFVDSQFSSIVSGAPKGTYNNLNALRTAHPNGTDGIFLVLENGHWYYWNSTLNAWTDGGVYQGVEVNDKTITPIKTTFVVQSDNLFNKDDSRNISGKFLNFSQSPPTQATNTDAEISHPIKATSGQKYTAIFDTVFFGAANARVALYDKSGNYIDRVTPSITGRMGIVTMPSIYPQLDHFRINYKKTDKDSLMVIKGDTYPSEYLSFPAKMTEDITLNGRQLGEVDKRVKASNPLYMQKLETAGDSIMSGAGDSGRGWPYRLAIKHQMTYNNRAIAGAVFARGVKTSEGAAVPSILDQITQFSGTAMYNLIEGGTNDADYSVPMGVITTGFNATLDETTFCGAFESACKRLINKGHGKQIGFIVAQKMGTVTWQNRRYPYFVKAMEICRKWGVPYLNLWDDFYLNPAVETLNTTYYVDTQHLKPAGYDLTTPLIENWMRDVLPAGIGGSTPVFDLEGRITKLELEKANRKQEEFKPIDLLNNWIPENTTIYHVPSYTKDELGFVHLRGIAIGGTGTIVFQLPVGYRPSKGEYFGGPRTRSSGSVNVLYYIDSSGRFYMYTPNTESGGSTIVNLSGITFKAD